MSSSEGVSRTAMNLPGSQHLVYVADENVDGFIEMGWKKVRVRQSTDTGSTPTQSRNTDR